MSKSDNSIFEHHEHALEKAIETCPRCETELSIKHGKTGSFFGCNNYPNCEYTRPVVEHEKVEDQLLSGSHCPLCDNTLAVKQGRYGMFIGCTNYPECEHIEDTNQHDDIDVDCPSCAKGKLFEKTNRYGKTFYSCDQYPSCKYVINYQPLNEACPECDWAILVSRKMASGDVAMCPQKKCNYKRKLP